MTDPLAIGALALLMCVGLIIVYRSLKKRLDDLGQTLSVLDQATAQAERLRKTEASEAGDNVDQALAQLKVLDERVQAMEGDIAEVLTATRKSRSVGVRETVERRFQLQGYLSIRVMGEVADEKSGGSRVAVEGVKRGINYKGHVLVVDGQVVEEHLISSYEAFP